MGWMCGGSKPARIGAAEHESREIYSVGSRPQATTGDDTADREDLVCATVNCRTWI
jgi:hypothetical protein